MPQCCTPNQIFTAGCSSHLCEKTCGEFTGSKTSKLKEANASALQNQQKWNASSDLFFWHRTLNCTIAVIATRLTYGSNLLHKNCPGDSHPWVKRPLTLVGNLGQESSPFLIEARCPRNPMDNHRSWWLHWLMVCLPFATTCCQTAAV